MYHTFQAGSTSGAPEGEGGKATRPVGGSRRISTSNACVECRRRKIRCDGTQPCGQCQWYQHPELCAYSKPAQRVVPSRKIVDKLQSQVDQYHSVFARLFPGKQLEDFLSLPREGLINLAVTLPASNPSVGNTPEPLGNIAEIVQRSDGAESLEALEQAPEQDPENDEVKRLRDKIQGISDDVNGLSISIDKASTYVGISSINAAMKVIFRTAPIARPFISNRSAETTEPSRANTPPPYVRDPDPNYLPPADVGEKLIDFYFAHIHVLMPMIDEDQFRHSYLYGTRTDPPWLALLNMVLALGSLASSTCDNEDHIAFYQRARKHIDAESFGSGSLFVLQALSLLSGYYLHYLNRPNEANGIMGATLRMATAHGLHREYSESHRNSPPGGTVIMSGLEVPVEIRRRTWWSLYCLDSWASITTGRPSLGRTGSGITIQSPRVPEQMNNAQYLASLRLLPIIHNIGFCKIATKVQDLLAAHSMIGYDDLFVLDSELEKWHDDLPPILRDVVDRPARTQRTSSISGNYKHISPKPPTSSASNKNPFDFSQPPERDKTACPEVLKTPRAIMHWRYQNLRILMHRPLLLATALRRTPYANMSTEEKLAVGRCRIVAGQAIADIDATCQEDLIAGWNAVWLMYQAVMVPLVSLFSVLALPPATANSESPSLTPGGSDASAIIPGSDEDTAKWKHEIERSIQFFDRMQHFSVAARKSRDVVQRLYDATKYVSEHHAQLHQQQQDMLRRRHSAAHPQPLNTDTMGAYEAVADPNHMALNAPDMVQNYAFMPARAWNMSPNAEAAMNEFWDDMMWDTLPTDLPDTSNFVENMEGGEWWQQPTQDWSHWNGNNV
ncbi:Lactose regulatory protein LAC9 [Fulvia fulva]|uniref:Lactose regulatory protein LAC9 n=1 Tax=Passalora fulva TaxID=5499 RepID=A0A9Q8P4W2_PASFU|nr:Lactose regulatory protein LAC9 [Fulvia fulva]KAK4632622.1 Lactose regulatory protein LAC9 [Fulvia fulva]UJO13378.1 Lactose regulatory protein LAC9 [Fulvia fulva]WPV11126.1 Lactose regulatory protein LAC9 [Fulvia fulva]